MNTDGVTQNCPLPNPLTPLAFLQPGIAGQLTNGSYLQCAILAVLIWDDLNHLRDDYRLFTRHRITPATVAYLVAKLSALGYCLGRAFLMTHPVENCKTLELAIDSLLVVFSSLDSILFYVRVCAMYYNKRFIVIFFGLCCLATIATACLIPVSIGTIHIGPTKYCIEFLTRSLLPTYITFLTFDTLVFLATTYRLFFLYSQDHGSFKKRMRLAIFGQSMPAFSKAMLHESQLYYLAVCLAKVPTVFGSVFITSAPGEIIIANLVVIHAILGNILTCRVYRNTRLGFARDSADHDSFARDHSNNSGRTVVPQLQAFLPSGNGAGKHDASSGSAKDSGQKEINLVDIHKETTMITVVDYPNGADFSNLPQTAKI